MSIQEPVDKTKPAIGTRRKSKWAVPAILLVILSGLAFAGGRLLQLVRYHQGDGTAGGNGSLTDAMLGIGQIAVNPRDGFPGKSKIVICCMGIDDNWTNQNTLYTTGTRTDTLFLTGLDFDNKKVSMLSIPRDTYVPIAGTDYSSKINSAYATGGPERTEKTVANFVGITPDYYIVLNIDATKRMVDALGGVDLMVEHQMDYDDNWGHLHVHLLPGFQHLDGEQAVAFARYRHGNKGVHAEDGDIRRVYRQHVLLRAMVDKAKSFTGVMNANQLVDTAMSCIRTNMTRTQLFDLAAIFRQVSQDDIQTAQLIGDDGRGPNNAYVMVVNPDTAHKYVDWLMRGNEMAGRAITPVVVENGTKTAGLAKLAADRLRAAGYVQVEVAGNAPLNSVTVVNDTGVPNREGSKDIAGTLGIVDAKLLRKPNEPNHLGWTAPSAITVILGDDYAAQAHTANAAGPTPATP